MDLHSLIDGLSRPSAYGKGVDSVLVHQTHISVVFLAGEHAYKIKKPVSLGFVDYSTLERRRQFCDEEVSLNRRLAPDVYLGTVPVTLEGHALKMEGAGEVVEWAVKMRRLPDSATLRSLLVADRVDPPAMAALARVIARFHRLADTVPRPDEHASFAAIAANARENLDQAESQVGLTVSRSTLDRLRERTELVLGRLRGTIDARAACGVPRDTHGDLRLDHVYWFPDRDPPGDWVIVDCIEFSPHYRHADPISDIAFLSMELTQEGRRDLADAFLDEYFECTGDREGRMLLPFYQSYRAAVRGKVEGMKMFDVEVPEAQRRAAGTRAKALWLRALAEAEEPCNRPCLVLLAGLPGTGKSTLARSLAESAGFEVIRSDEVRKEIAGLDPSSPRPAGFGEDLYTSEWDDRTYAECLRRAEDRLYHGGRVLIDASFRNETRRRRFLDAASQFGVAGLMLVCRADPAVVQERLLERRDDVSDAGWAIYLEAARRWDEPGAKTRMAIREVDCGGTREHALAQARSALCLAGLMDAGSSSSVILAKTPIFQLTADQVEVPDLDHGIRPRAGQPGAPGVKGQDGDQGVMAGKPEQRARSSRVVDRVDRDDPELGSDGQDLAVG